MNNENLIRAIESLRESPNQESSSEFIKALFDSKLMLPAEKTKGGVKIIKILNKKSEPFLVAYTDQENMAKSSVRSQYILATINDYIKLLRKDETLKGLVINPYEQNLELQRQTVLGLSEDDESEVKISLGLPARDVSDIVKRIKEVLTPMPDVKAAYLVQTVQGEDKSASLMVALDTTNANRVKSVGQSLTGILAPGEPLDIVLTDDGLGNYISKNFKPVFLRNNGIHDR